MGWKHVVWGPSTEAFIAVSFGQDTKAAIKETAYRIEHAASTSGKRNPHGAHPGD
jgi:hypothetical protein